MVKIHYFFDPMCGWCFGATEVIKLLKEQGIKLELHPGGMIQRRAMDSGFRKVVLGYDAKIESLTGQHFGEKYKARISGNSDVILDSFVTAKAIFIVETLIAKGVEMLKAIQEAYYQQGLDVSDKAVLAQLANDLGIESADWQQHMQSSNKQIDTLIDQSRQMMASMQLQGFPSLVLESEAQTGSKFTLIPHSQFYGDLTSCKQWLEQNI